MASAPEGRFSTNQGWLRTSATLGRASGGGRSMLASNWRQLLDTCIHISRMLSKKPECMEPTYEVPQAGCQAKTSLPWWLPVQAFSKMFQEIVRAAQSPQCFLPLGSPAGASGNCPLNSPRAVAQDLFIYASVAVSHLCLL